MLFFFFLIVNVRVTNIKITWNYYPLSQPTAAAAAAKSLQLTEYPLIYSNIVILHTLELTELLLLPRSGK